MKQDDAKVAICRLLNGHKIHYYASNIMGNSTKGVRVEMIGKWMPVQKIYYISYIRFENGEEFGAK